jgi:Zn-dependent M16 (insulinase) family peptidase
MNITNTNLQRGQKLESGFEIIDIVDLAELKAAGIWAKHIASGAEVFHVLNDDSENLFAFAFATPPNDSTGAAHILEHSVLCGSKNYPLKDAFIVLAQGSLQTFLNAMTYPDKTVYPASSTNEHDYFNLMSVYGDSVFHPLLDEWIFQQEGHRLEFVSDEKSGGEKLSITGVVYNEMKGAYSSLDNYAGDWSVRALLPNTVYDFDSGGDPVNIPDLTWQGLKDFHAEHYNPANCRIFLAGNIPTEKQLSFINEKFLSNENTFLSIPAGKKIPQIPLATRWTEPKTIHVESPAGAEQKPTVMISWLCNDTTDRAETLALAALSEILLGHDGSPILRALIESRFGEDLAPASGLEGSLREIIFSLGLRGVKIQDAEKVQDFIFDELARLEKNGIPQEEIEAALLTMEFTNREIKRSGGPYSLVWLGRSLRGWLHGANPWETLLFVPAFKELKKNVQNNPRYFESLIKKYFLDNPHRALVVVEPKEDFLDKQQEALEKKLSEKLSSMDDAERKAVKEKSQTLERIQSESDTPENLAKIPHLSRSELDTHIEKTPRNILNHSGIPVVTHNLFTNGITYMDLAFPLDIFDPSDYPWFGFFSDVVVSVGLPGMDYGEVSSLTARTVGSFYAMIQTGLCFQDCGSIAKTSAGNFDILGRDWIMFRFKCLDEKIDESLKLVSEIICKADFSDHRRIEDLVLEIKNDIDSSLAPSGSQYAAERASRNFSRTKAIEEIWNGITQIEFIHQLAKMKTKDIAKKLTSIRDKIALYAGLIAHITASDNAIDKALVSFKNYFENYKAPQPENPASKLLSSFLNIIDEMGNNKNKKVEKLESTKTELYHSASLQVGFAAKVMKAASYNTIEHAAELVFSHSLSTGALWEEIRMKGGAYGASAHPDGIENLFTLSTYRDPDPVRSLETFSKVLEKESTQIENDSEIEKAVIGTFSKETRPRTNAEKGAGDFFRFLYGIEDEHREQKLTQIVKVSADDVQKAAARLAVQFQHGDAVLIAGNRIAKAAAKKLGSEIKNLPV